MMSLSMESCFSKLKLCFGGGKIEVSKFQRIVKSLLRF